jgi:endo-1,4-beta-xylanase
MLLISRGSNRSRQMLLRSLQKSARCSWIALAAGVVACGGTGSITPPLGGGAGQGVGGSMTSGSGGATASGTTTPGVSTGGAGIGGGISTGGMVATGGNTPAAGGAATGGKAAAGGAATGGKAATGGSSAAGGAATGGATAVAGGSSVDCSTAMPTGGTTHPYTGSWATDNGTANGLGWGMWSSGTGGSITSFANAHAFAASWNNSADFLAHLGLDFNPPKVYTAYGTIAAQFVEIKSGTAGGFSMIGMYGWMHSPCIEWYINEDSYNGLRPSGSVTATIDGATYYLTSAMTTGTGGANACESGHTGSWRQMISTRATARQCGTITVSDHFAAWAAQPSWGGLGTLTSVHINVETGGGTGSIQFPVANVTTTSK